MYLIGWGEEPEGRGETFQQAVKPQSAEAPQENWPPTQVLVKRDAFLCTLEPCNADVYCP